MHRKSKPRKNAKLLPLIEPHATLQYHRTLLHVDAAPLSYLGLREIHLVCHRANQVVLQLGGGQAEPALLAWARRVGGFAAAGVPRGLRRGGGGGRAVQVAYLSMLFSASGAAGLARFLIVL